LNNDGHALGRETQGPLDIMVREYPP
jgi:hypothetical protein